MLLRLEFVLFVLSAAVCAVYCSYEVWPEPVDDGRQNYPKPTSWSDKNYGQWCRNRTINQHVQCRMGSAFHLYVCCGETGTDCCFRLQPVVLAYGGGLGMVFVISVIFGLLLKFNIICPITDDREDVEYQDVPKNSS